MAIFDLNRYHFSRSVVSLIKTPFSFLLIDFKVINDWIFLFDHWRKFYNTTCWLTLKHWIVILTLMPTLEKLLFAEWIAEFEELNNGIGYFERKGSNHHRQIHFNIHVPTHVFHVVIGGRPPCFGRFGWWDKCWNMIIAVLEYQRHDCATSFIALVAKWISITIRIIITPPSLA